MGEVKQRTTFSLHPYNVQKLEQAQKEMKKSQSEIIDMLIEAQLYTIMDDFKRSMHLWKIKKQESVEAPQ